MTQFMIFGNKAINMALVTVMMDQGDHCVCLSIQGGNNVLVSGVTIDDILTAQAAGQARINACVKNYDEPSYNEMTERILAPAKTFSQQRSSRFKEPQQNDPQAMKLIGRR